MVNFFADCGPAFPQLRENNKAVKTMSTAINLFISLVLSEVFLFLNPVLSLETQKTESVPGAVATGLPFQGSIVPVIETRSLPLLALIKNHDSRSACQQMLHDPGADETICASDQKSLV